MLRLALALVLFPGCLFAGELGITEVPYENINVAPGDRIDFDLLPEPVAARRYSGILTIGAVSFGEVFAGQTLGEEQDGRLNVHDVVKAGKPTAPIALAVIHPSENFAVAYTSIFGSQALFAVGPIWRAGQINVGTGSLAILFATDQCAFGIKTRLSGRYIATYYRHQPIGILKVVFVDRAGVELGSLSRFQHTGPFFMGYEQTGTAMPKIAGVLIQNLNNGGIGIDEIIFSDRCGLMLS